MSHADPEAGRGIKPALGAYFIIPLLACGLTLYFLVSTWNLVWEARSTGTFIGVILLLLAKPVRRMLGGSDTSPATPGH